MLAYLYLIQCDLKSGLNESSRKYFIIYTFISPAYSYLWLAVTTNHYLPTQHTITQQHTSHNMFLSSTSLAIIILSLTSLSYTEKVDTCIMCTSDSASGSNVECENTVVPETQPNGACSAEFGNDYCYVLVTRQKQPVEAWMWNSKLCGHCAAV